MNKLILVGLLATSFNVSAVSDAHSATCSYYNRISLMGTEAYDKIASGMILESIDRNSYSSRQAERSVNSLLKNSAKGMNLIDLHCIKYPDSKLDKTIRIVLKVVAS